MPAAEPKLRLAIVGTGDVAYRHYLPALEPLAEQVAITAFVDPRPGAAERAAASVVAWSPGAASYTDLDAMLTDGVAEAAIDLAPAPRHGSVNAAILEAGLHLYSEKPPAASVAEADRLIATAAERGVRFLCAPGVAVTRPLPLAGRAHRLGALRPAHAGGDAPRRSRPGRVARVHGRPDTVLRRRRGPGLRPRRVSPARAHDAARPGRAGPGDGHDRDADPGGPRRPAHRPHDRGHDARPRPDQPPVRERGPRPAAGELRHARLARSMAGAAFPDGHPELQRPGLRRRRSGQPVRR